MSEAHDPQLYNEDLAPATPERRTWRMLHLAALWAGMMACVPTDMLAWGLVAEGMSWW